MSLSMSLTKGVEMCQCPHQPFRNDPGHCFPPGHQDIDGSSDYKHTATQPPYTIQIQLYIHCTPAKSMPKSILERRMLCSTMSNVLHKFRQMTPFPHPPASYLFQKNTKLISFDMPSMKPYFLSQITSFSMCIYIVPRRIFSVILLSTKVRLTSLQFAGSSFSYLFLLFQKQFFPFPVNGNFTSLPLHL